MKFLNSKYKTKEFLIIIRVRYFYWAFLRIAVSKTHVRDFANGMKQLEIILNERFQIK